MLESAGLVDSYEREPGGGKAWPQFPTAAALENSSYVCYLWTGVIRGARLDVYATR